jgi:hypothetical protein
MPIRVINKTNLKIHAFRLLSGYYSTHEDLIKFPSYMNIEFAELNDTIKYFSHCRHLYLNYKNFYNHFGAVLNFFKYNSDLETIDKLEPLTKDEVLINQRTLSSGLVTLNEDYKLKTQQVYSYDFSSEYSHILLNMSHPFKQGEVKSIESIPDYNKLAYGIYRVKIFNTNNDFKRVFNFSKENHYTSHILKSLAQYVSVLGLSFELLKPDSIYNYNCLIYTNDKLIEGKVSFKNWLEILLLAKQKIPNNKLLKHLNSLLWGSLIAYKKIYIDESEIQDYDVSYLGQNIDTEYKIIKDHDNKDGSSMHSMIDFK